MGSDYSGFSDKELYDILEKSSLAEKLKVSEEWKMLQEAANRIIERAIDEFAVRTKADDKTKIIELQTIIKKYRYGTFNEVNLLQQEGEMAFSEAKERGLVGNWIANIKKKVGLQ